MASSVSSVALVPVNAIPPRSVALRPVDADAQPQATPGFDPEALRRTQALQATTLREAPSGQTSEQRGDTAETGEDQRSSGRRPAGDSAPFLAQLLAQDQPPSRPRDPFAQASRAYGRLQEEPRIGFVLDMPARIDVKV
jgi:hypothetical protein